MGHRVPLIDRRFISGQIKDYGVRDDLAKNIDFSRIGQRLTLSIAKIEYLESKI